MKLSNINLELKELTLQEINEINGGESVWYWIAYGVGYAASVTNDYLNTVREINAKHHLVGVK